MTPRQRRLHRAGLETVAAAPRKSWLGRFTPLNGIQSAWIKSLLTVWGEGMRGGAAPRKPSGHSCWRGMKGDHWSDRALERFTAAIEQARSEGYRGRQALSRRMPFCGQNLQLWPLTLRSLRMMLNLLNDVYWRYLKRVILFISLALTITPPAKKSQT